MNKMWFRHLAGSLYNWGILLVPTLLLLLSPTPYILFGLLITPTFYLLRRLAFGQWIPPTRVNAPVLVLLAMLAIALMISPARDLAVLTAGPALAGVTFFFFLVDRLQTSIDFTRAIRVVALGGLAIALAAPMTTEPGPTPLLGSTAVAIYSWSPRIFKISNPNIVAGGLAILAPFALALVAQKNWPWRAVGAAAFAAMAFGILLLESRGALFALGFGVAVWATLYQRWLLPLIPVAIIALLALNQAVHGPSIPQFVYGRIGTPKGGTIIERQEMWLQATSLIRSSPFLGIGLGAFPRVASITAPYSPDNPGPSPNHAHNTFFQVALDTGVVGAVAFIALLFSGIYFAWRAYRAEIQRDGAIAMLSAFAILIIHGFGDTVVWGTAKTGLLFWLLVSFGISLDKANKVV